MNGNSWTESNWAGSELRVVGLLTKIMLYENVVWLLSGVAVEENLQLGDLPIKFDPFP